MGARQAHDLGPADVEFRQGRGQGHGLGQAVFGQAAGIGRPKRRVQHPGARRLGRGVTQALPLTRKQQVGVVLR